MRANAIEMVDNIVLPAAAAAVDGPALEAFDTRSPCSLTWVIETMDKTQTAAAAAAAAAASAVVVEVFDNIQNLCCLTAPYLTLTWSSQRDRSRGLDQSPSAPSSARREMYGQRHQHQRDHNRTALPASRRSCNIASCPTYLSQP